MNENYASILEKQLAVDYDCSLDDVRSGENIFRLIKKNADARPVANDDSMLKIAVYREKLLVMADSRIIDWCRETFGEANGTWFSEPHNLIKIHSKLQEYGQALADTHHHYLPAKDFPPVTVREDVEVRFYEQDEIDVFRGDGRFWEALLFDENTPDMLAVCAIQKLSILGMASATRDCESLWQIGVNVTDEGRGMGIGTYVTALLKDELLRRGIVPTYATVESHIKSQRVAFHAGFEPVFYELFSSKQI